ncbi:MAG: PTS sugar transporter subunit IIA [Bacillota bacterium]|jgi:PTS system galactitol-specific IIA component
MSSRQHDQVNSGFAINEDLVLMNQIASSRDQILMDLSDLLYTHGYVKDSFPEALLKREKEFPTGLLTSSVGIAIPHTDIDHVIRPAIAIATMVEPVTFQVMASPDETVPVHVVILMAIHKPEAQLSMLQKIIEMIQNKEALEQLHAAQSKSEVVGIVKQYLFATGGESLN